MKKALPQTLFAVLISSLALIFYFDTTDMPKAAYQFPRILIVLVILLSIIMVLEQLFFRKDGTANNSSVDEEIIVSPPVHINKKRVLLFLLLVGTYILTIKPIGYLVVTPLYLLGTLSMLRATKIRFTITIAAGFTVFIYLVFVLLLRLPIPMGILS